MTGNLKHVVWFLFVIPRNCI